MAIAAFPARRTLCLAVNVVFLCVISEAKPESFNLIFLTPFPLPLELLTEWGTNDGLPWTIFSNLISESGIFVQECWIAKSFEIFLRAPFVQF